MTTTLSRTPITSPLGKAEQKAVGLALQSALTDLIDLSLLAKQAHWNVVGRDFKTVHLHLDEVVDSAREFSDAVAERAAALGISPDGRTATVTEAKGLPQLPAGYLRTHEAVSAIVEVLDKLTQRLRGHIAATETADPVTQDLFISITAKIEEHRWMFQAQLAD
ncbi:Dps family protein [Nocardia sp. NPDC055321]